MKQYVVDAFSERVFGGNPAAICVMDEWLPDELMQQIAKENNIAETAFAVPEGGKYRLRWFTTACEIDLCGHATLACAYVLFNFYLPDADVLNFITLSGDLWVRRLPGGLYELDLPRYQLRPTPVTPAMTAAFGVEPRAAYLGRDLLCVFDDEAAVRDMRPDIEAVRGLPGMLAHVTAPGREFACISRSFVPKAGADEDPVCGSGHCHIVPYWAERLQRQDIVAYQASERGGILYCRLEGERVKLAGPAALYAIADILPEQPQ